MKNLCNQANGSATKASECESRDTDREASARMFRSARLAVRRSRKFPTKILCATPGRSVNRRQALYKSGQVAEARLNLIQLFMFTTDGLGLANR